MRNLEHQVNQGEISYSRMVEILNETIQPTTPQPSKSASEILKQYELFNYNDGNIDETHVYFENAVTAMKEYASQFQQPHPQDSSSWEVEKSDYSFESGIKDFHKHKQVVLTLGDTFGQNDLVYAPGETNGQPKLFNYDSKINYSTYYKSRFFKVENIKVLDQSPPASESLEQAAKSFLMDRINKHCVVSFDGRLIMLSNPLTADVIVEWIVEFATQQQKPLVVLPEILQDKYAWSRIVKIVKKVKEELPESSNTVIGIECIREVCREIHNELSASNGVDLKPIIQSLFNVTFMAQKLWDESKPIKDNEFMTVTHPTIIEAQEHLVKYRDLITEQSQQQNKGNG